MFRALIRWLKAVGLLLTGHVDPDSRALGSHPTVVRARYDEVIQEKLGRIQQYQQAVAQLIAQEQTKVQKVRDLNEEVALLTGRKAEALARAKQVTEGQRLAGSSVQDIKADFEYQRFLAAYNDFSSTLAEKELRIQDLESDVRVFRASIEEHKVQLRRLSRELETLRTEASEAVADVITARHEREIADTLIGISLDGAFEELEELRNMRNRLKAEARVAKDTVGALARDDQDDILAYAADSLVTSEFESLLGLADGGGDARTSETRTAVSPPHLAVPE